MKALLAVLLFSLAGCGGPGSLLNPYDRTQVPRVTVDLPPGAPPQFRWTPADAEWVEVRDASGRTVWRVREGGGMHGVLPVTSPVAYGAGFPHDQPPPPDGSVIVMTTPPEPLRPGATYTVIVHRRDERAAASGGGFTGLRPNVYEGTATFTVR
ncbi:MAG TPA: hypothetical protein VK610_10555 [Rhodothermales bacterium]|nr:hypothetical protein [Rhodothermales bacterium]